MVAGQDLAGTAARAEACGEVEGRSAEAVADRDRLAGVDADADTALEAGGARLSLQRDGGLEASRVESNTARASSPRISTSSPWCSSTA